jgi:hypothetical protein
MILLILRYEFVDDDFVLVLDWNLRKLLGFLDDEVLGELQCVLQFFLRLICFGGGERMQILFSDIFC